MHSGCNAPKLADRKGVSARDCRAPPGRQWCVHSAETLCPVWRTIRPLTLVGGMILGLGASAAAAEECTRVTDPIETDRPDVTDSAVVVPRIAPTRTGLRRQVVVFGAVSKL
jgi:hypothetical protein